MANKNYKPREKLTIREKKFVRNRVMGMTNDRAYLAAGYKASSKAIAQVHGSEVNTRPHIQAAINAALDKQGLSPEWAVEQLGKVAAQDDEIGAKRLAAKDILELHGWNKAERPTMQLQVKNAFFGGGRQTQTQEQEIIDVAGTTAE